MPPTLIDKADGTVEAFDEAKLVHSLERAGASAGTIDKIRAKVRNDVREKITSYHIYRHAFALLRKYEKPAAARYSLRRALTVLGPSGFPFESFIAELFKMRGFETKIRQTLMGSCVEHEVDVVAWNENKLLMVESKFHNQQGIKSDLKIALYVKARFDDLADKTYEYGHPRQLDEGWLVTNTKFSRNAIQFANCANLRLLGWNYPEKGNLQDLINEYSLHPITSLPSLSKGEREIMLQNDIVLCKHVDSMSERLKSLGIPENRLRTLSREAADVCIVP